MEPIPVISVLMPVYNAQRHLRQAMDSILAQSFADFEFLCVDDGSTDDSPAILREYARRDPRVKIITKPNGGVTSALNAGLKVATGEFIARMDADDIAMPTRFAEQLELMRLNAELAAVGCHVIHMDANGVDRHTSPPINTHEEITRCLWDGNSSALPHYGAFMRRSTLTQVGNYREEFRTAQDLDLFLRLSEVGKLQNVSRPLMRYRVHEGSVGARRSQEQARNAREILRQAYERRGQPLPKKLAKWDNVVVRINRLRWGWAALAEGRYADARGHAWSVLRGAPFAKYAWQLAFHAALGPTRPALRKLVRSLRGRCVGSASADAMVPRQSRVPEAMSASAEAGPMSKPPPEPPAITTSAAMDATLPPQARGPEPILASAEADSTSNPASKAPAHSSGGHS